MPEISVFLKLNPRKNYHISNYENSEESVQISLGEISTWVKNYSAGCIFKLSGRS